MILVYRRATPSVTPFIRLGGESTVRVKNLARTHCNDSLLGFETGPLDSQSSVPPVTAPNRTVPVQLLLSWRSCLQRILSCPCFLEAVILKVNADYILGNQGGALVERRWAISYRITLLVPHPSSCVTSGLVECQTPNLVPSVSHLTAAQEQARRGGKMRDPGNEFVKHPTLLTI